MATLVYIALFAVAVGVSIVLVYGWCEWVDKWVDRQGVPETPETRKP